MESSRWGCTGVHKPEEPITEEQERKLANHRGEFYLLTEIICNSYFIGPCGRNILFKLKKIMQTTAKKLYLL